MHSAGIGVWSRDLSDEKAPPSWSAVMKAQFGLPPDADIDRSTFERVLHPEDLSRALALYRRAIENREPYDAVYRVVASGRVRTIHARGGATYDAQGRPLRFDGFTLDVTDRLETERQLLETRSRLESMLAAADVCSWSLDLPADRIVGDAKLIALCGIDAVPDEPFPIDLVWERVHPDDLDRVFSTFHKAARSGDLWSVEHRIVADGAERWVSVRGRIETDPDGTPRRAVGIAIDVTASRESARRQLFRADLLDALRGLSDAKAIVGVACRMIGAFLGASRATYGLVDLASGTIELSTPYASGVEPVEGTVRYADYGDGLLDRIQEGRPLAVADVKTDPLTRGQSADYAALQIRSFVIVPLFRDGTLAATFTVHDRNPHDWTPQTRELLESVAQRTWDALQRAQVEEALRALNKALDARVRERTAELQQANDELQAFAHTVSHDMRAPLRNIQGMGRILLEDLGDWIDEEHRDLLERQGKSALRLSKMIDDLLGFARLGRETVTKEPFDLGKLAETVRNDLLSPEMRHNCRVEISPDLDAIGDLRLVRFVLLNLMENACKFSPGGGTVRVGRDAEGAFFVADEGVGFEASQAERIFQPFERLVSERQFPGTGIGLANVQRIVSRHGGRVWAESTPGQGSTFRFTLG